MHLVWCDLAGIFLLDVECGDERAKEVGGGTGGVKGAPCWEVVRADGPVYPAWEAKRIATSRLCRVVPTPRATAWGMGARW